MRDPSTKFYKDLIDHLYDGVYFVDVNRRITYWNEGAERLTGYSAQEVLGYSCANQLLSHINEDGCQLCLTLCPLAATMRDGQPREAHIYLKHKSGHRVPVCVRTSPITDEEGTIIGGVEVFSDNSAYQRQLDRAVQLERDAYFDLVTELPNRRAIEGEFKARLAAGRQRHSAFGVALCDIDHFKLVNDRYGHRSGDDVLRAVSKSLTLSLRGADRVGRWGGEEFLLLIDVENSQKLDEIAERCRILIANCAVPDRDTNDIITVTASFGAIMAYPGDDPETIFREVDQLLYFSKAGGRNRVTSPNLLLTPSKPAESDPGCRAEHADTADTGLADIRSDSDLS